MTPDNRHLFTFAVIADTHLNQAEGSSSSPYACNALANARTRRVIAELNHLRPDFVVHLGDIVNPVPELPTYGEAAERFERLAAGLEAPLHLVPGNHDVGDKPVSWMPAGTVNDHHLELYRGHFGADWYAFDHRELHVVVVNTPILNSGLAADVEQRAWLEADLAAHEGRRIVLCLHYPPYVSDPDENGCYDNIDEPARSWLLGLVDRYRPEAVFCGHVHNFWYDRRGDTEIWLLPSTAFVRHDYSEFFRIGPADEFGRDDRAKLGYFVVRVHERGMVVENVRSHGRTLAEGELLPAPPPRLGGVDSRESTLVTLGVDMRHPWAEEMEISPSGAVDEFERKIARNDYPLLALWEMGLRRMRVPVQDLRSPRTRRRMQVLAEVGHLFQVYVYGCPDQDTTSLIAAHRGLVDVLEVVLPWESRETALPRLAATKRQSGCRILLSRVNRKDAAKFEGARYNHLISHGFTLAEADDLAAFVDVIDTAGTADGFVFRVPRETAPATAALVARELCDRLRRSACLYVRSSGSSPAEAHLDDHANAARVAEAVLAATADPRVSVILDTFDDADRGYFARSGLVDRRCNPRLAGRVVRSLVALLNTGGWRLETSADASCTVRSAAGSCLRLTTGAHGEPPDASPAGARRLLVDLGNGDIRRLGDDDPLPGGDTLVAVLDLAAAEPSPVADALGTPSPAMALAEEHRR